MYLLLYLPVTTVTAFIIAVFMILGKAKGKDIKYTVLFIFMAGTGLIFSLIEYILLFSKYGWDETVIMAKIIFFILPVLVNGFNCLGKGIVVSKGYGEKNVDYAGITGKLNMFDPLCLIVMIVTVLVFR